MDNHNPQNKTMLYGIGALLVAIAAYLLFFKKGSAATTVAPTPTNTTSNNTGTYGYCVNVPAFYEKWDGIAVIPGNATAILGHEPTDSEKQIMIGFFRAAGIKVTDSNATAMKAELLKWMGSVPTPHWNIVENSLRCDMSASFARRLR